MKIGLTYTGFEEKHQNYVQWLKGADKMEIIKLSADETPGTLTDIDALVLSGGIDTHPKFYNGIEDYTGKPENGWNEKRDQFELEVLGRALERKIPVLGICRGLQLINIFQGGNLFQHIQPAVAHQGGPDKKHMINIHPNTLLSKITETSEADFVNSAHHQAIDIMGENLQENSRSDDNIIEGIEWKEKSNRSFLLGVQWHPERMKSFGLNNSPLSKNIRDHFIEAVQKYINQ